MDQQSVRQRYWARSLVGWRHFSAAEPNAAHHALARLEAAGRIELLVTQNVDGLHTRAGSRRVLDLHGRLEHVRCMTCAHSVPRAQFQRDLESANPGWAGLAGQLAPDGDVDLERDDFSGFIVPACARCAGVLKPDVVFYGENVPHERVASALRGLAAADAMLIAGSSLMVYSGYRFAAAAAAAGKPIAAVNLGRTRADELLALKVAQPCAEAFAFALAD
jgi:NAD-dependent SIR2 family protein deacetylase